MSSDRPEERDAVRTTIVGGRPPGSGKDTGEIPRGIEVLVSKASVDAEFRALLLDGRAEAAEAIGLTLSPTEAMMLNAIPEAQLDAVITRTKVAPANRRAFLSGAAAVMLAALGAGSCCCIQGARPDRPAAVVTDGSYVVFAESDFRHIQRRTYGVADADGLARRRAEVARANYLRHRALALARQQWNEDPAHRGVLFPIKSLREFRLLHVRAFNDEAEARAELTARQENDQKRRDALAERDATYLATLDEAGLNRITASDTALRKAEQLFEHALRSLLAQNI